MNAKTSAVLAGLFVLCLATFPRTGEAEKVRVGKNPGQIQGRWLEIASAGALDGYTGVYLGEVSSDIQWPQEGKETPIDEELLDEKIRQNVLLNLRSSSLFSQVVDEPPADDATGFLRLDCELRVDPGSRVARYFVGMGAGKSKSIFEIHLVDHATGEEVGLYHGYGTGSGMGFKLAGGGARKMTEDDIEENAERFAELLAEVR